MKKIFLVIIILCCNNVFSYPRLLIKIPTRSRPLQFFEQLDRYYQKLSGKAPYQFLISCDIDDTTMNNPEIEKRFKSYPHLHYRFNANKSKIEAYNANIDEFIDQFDILIVTSDDLKPMIDNYDLLIIKEMNKHFPQLDGVLNFSDGRDAKNINTYPILGIKYYLQFNYIYYPEYNSFFCDNELVDVSNILKKEVYYSTTLFKHNFGWDQLYERNQKFWNSDQSLYEKRKLENFYLNIQEINNEA